MQTLCDSTATDQAADSSGGLRTIQIHPTLRCNLRCRHCYSFSAPAFRESLALEPLQRFLTYAYAQGFHAISLSGGEPLLYPALEDLLVFSKSLGYVNAMVSNGMLLGSAKAKRVLAQLDLVALSIDGRAAYHDFVRGQPGAFGQLLKGIEVLKQHQKNFGFIHTLTRQNWDSLLWLGEFAFEAGAQLLQLHPVEAAGRATEELTDSMLDNLTLHKIFVLANYLKTKYADTMNVQLDLLHGDYVSAFPQALGVPEEHPAQAPLLTDLVSNLVVDEQGDIIPISYGLSKQYRIGNIYQDPDADIFGMYMSTHSEALQNLLRQTYRKVTSPTHPEMINWSEQLVQESFHPHTA